jgi:tRNA(fMet)-specific endonuclease VapC
MELLDTDTLIEVLRGNPSAVETFSTRTAATTLGASAITAAELFHGAARSSDPPTRTTEVKTLLSQLETLQVDGAVAERFGAIKTNLQRQGRVIADFDLLIAATALVHAVTLVTHNIRDFARIPGLVLDDWLR